MRAFTFAPVVDYEWVAVVSTWHSRTEPVSIPIAPSAPESWQSPCLSRIGIFYALLPIVCHLPRSCPSWKLIAVLLVPWPVPSAQSAGRLALSAASWPLGEDRTSAHRRFRGPESAEVTWL